MDNKENKNGQTENNDNQGMAMQFVGIALKDLAAHIDRSISGSVGAEEEKEQQPCHSHYQFLADGRRNKPDKPHTRTP